jgi:cytochrome c
MRSWVKESLIGITLIVGFGAPALAGDAEAGKTVFAARCSACHQVGPNAQVVVGPPLNGIVGAKAGAHEGYASRYSPGMKKLGEEGYVWNEEHLDAWIANPTALLPKTMMVGIKIPDPTERANIIAYLKTIPK